MLGPLLPFLADDPASIQALMTRVADAGADAIWVDAMNPRPRVWPVVADLLRAEFPGLLSRYRRILFDAAARAEYLGSLQTRIERAAQRAGVADRVRACI
jgi:DNA repair photolyase